MAKRDQRATDETWMRRCLALAVRGASTVSPNPMVGAVVLDRRGRLVGEGHHERAGEAHGEVVALAAAGSQARGGTLYVNLEPCNHRGRTGPCSEAVAAAGVARLVYGVGDPVRGHGGGARALKRAGLAVEGRVLPLECERLNRIFFTHARRRRPHVVVKAASTLDGKSATRTGESKWITSADARRHGRGLRKVLDAICVGVGTVAADDPKLTARARGFRDPIRVILDSKLRTPTSALVLPGNSRSSARCIVATTEKAAKTRERRLADAGAEVWRLGRGERVALPALLTRLAKESVTSVLVEGGPTAIAECTRLGLVDELRLYLAGRVFGGDRGGWLGGAGVTALADGPRFDIIDVETVGGDLAITALTRRR